MVDKQIKICDLCEKKIMRVADNEALLWCNETYQSWPRNENDKAPLDVCQACCIVLAEAQQAGIIDFDKDMIWRFCGWTQDKAGFWNKETDE